MSKKNSKKVAATVVALPKFDKKNAKAFGDFLFSEKGGVISCVKLCDGTLQNGKEGGRTIHCAVGEAYFTFVNHSLKSVLQKDRNANEYISKFDDGGLNSNGSTAAAIDGLVEVAQLKDNSAEGKSELARALDDCMASNDDGSSEKDATTYFERAQQVARTWNTQVVPLLK